MGPAFSQDQLPWRQRSSSMQFRPLETPDFPAQVQFWRHKFEFQLQDKRVTSCSKGDIASTFLTS